MIYCNMMMMMIIIILSLCKIEFTNSMNISSSSASSSSSSSNESITMIDGGDTEEDTQWLEFESLRHIASYIPLNQMNARASFKRLQIVYDLEHIDDKLILSRYGNNAKQLEIFALKHRLYQYIDPQYIARVAGKYGRVHWFITAITFGLLKYEHAVEHFMEDSISYATRKGILKQFQLDINQLLNHHNYHMRLVHNLNNIALLAVLCGNMNYIHFFLNEERFRMNPLVWNYAAFLGRKQIIDLLMERNEYMSIGNTMEMAALGGHLSILRDVYTISRTHANVITMPILRYAAKGGHIHILQWLNSILPHRNWYDLYFHTNVPQIDASVYLGAIYGGQLHVLQWLSNVDVNDSHKPIITWDNWSCTHAAESGQLHILQYLRDPTQHAKGRYATWNAETCSAAVRSGNCTVIRWLLDRRGHPSGVTAPCDEDMCRIAVEMENSDVIQLLLTQHNHIQSPCHLDVLIHWAHQLKKLQLLKILKSLQ